MDEARRKAVGIIAGPGRKLIPILGRYKHKELSEICPFCGSRHIHGKGDGHRIPHCAPPDSCEYVMGSKSVFKNEKGELFDYENGYYLKTITIGDYHP